MDNKIIFVRTDKGEEDIRSRTPRLSGDIKRALLMVDGHASFGELSKRAAPSLRGVFNELFAELEKSGFIQDKAKSGSIPKMAIPGKMSIPAKKPTDESLEELDFTAAFRVPTPAALAAEAAKVAKADAERLQVEQKAKQEAEAKARAEHERQAREQAEAARLKAEQEAAKMRAELAAAKAEAERAKKEAEARARAEAEARAQQEIEATKLKAQQVAKAARLKVEQEAARAREEAELAKRKAEEAAKAREEAERQAREKEKAEAARLKAELEAAQARAELAAARAKAEAEAHARAEAEDRARKEVEAAKQRAEQEAKMARLKAAQEAEAARVKAEQEAAKAREEAEQARQQAAETARVREEAEHQAREQAEAARLKAEQEAAEARAELAAAQAKAEADARAHAEAEARAREEAEAARLKAQQEAAQAREEAELAKRQAAEAAKAREDAEHQAREQAEQDTARARAELAEAKAEAGSRAHLEAEKRAHEEAEAARAESEQVAQEAEPQSEISHAVGESTTSKRKAAGESGKRSTSVTVLFFDVVGYTKQPVNKQIRVKKQFNQLVSDCLATLGEGERIILDTGDGAAIGFLQHPEDALEVARQFRKAVIDHRHEDYPDLVVRTGIHLGPINIVKDMNGQSNMVGDGINDAQRVMSFAGDDQVYISRPYYDFISRLSDEYANLFQYRGLQQDKHGREHAVYELVDPEVVEVRSPASDAALSIKLEPFSFAMPEVAAPKSEPPAQEESAAQGESVELIAAPVYKPEEGRDIQTPPDSSEGGKAAQPVAAEVAKDKAKVAEVHMPTEEEVAALAAEQSKVWSEAERRAAKERKKQAVQEGTPAPNVEKPVVRVKRKPVPWGMVGAGLLVLLVAALFIVPLVLPMQDYAARLQQSLSARLEQPVRIGQMSGRLLPSPQLELTDMSIGESGQVRIRLARVDFAFSALFGGTRPIDNLELEGMQVNGAVLQQLPLWLQQLASEPQAPLARVALSQATLETDGLQLSGIGGELSFDGAGKFSRARLHANDQKFGLDISAAEQGKLAVAILVRASALPLLPAWNFEELRANGELTRDELVITDLDGSIMDGRLLGDARLSWASGWRVKGNLVAKAVTVQKMGSALSGDMDATARFLMQSDTLSGLPDSSSLSGSFVVSKGVITGIDIVETARLRSRESLPGGRTHFDELSGELTVENGNYRFRQIKMKAGVLSASGSLDMAKRELSGQISASLSMRAGMGTAALQIGGTAAAPSVRAR